MYTPLPETVVAYLKGVGPTRAALLQKELGIVYCKDLLQHYPFRYIDRSVFVRCGDIREGIAHVQMIGNVTNIQLSGKARTRRLQARFADDSGSVELIWFQQIDYWMKFLRENVPYVVFGKPAWFQTKWSIAHPEIELYTGQQAEAGGKLVPVYSVSEKMRRSHMDSKAIVRLTEQIVQRLTEAEYTDFIPAEQLAGLQLISRYQAIRAIHFPTSEQSIEQARRRIKFDEFFAIQLRLLGRKTRMERSRRGALFPKVDGLFTRYYQEYIPFALTGAQARVMKEIRKDVLSGKVMNRLLQGDVGSGKTMVALLTMLMAVENGYQACMMAPTEILAQQHFTFLSQEAEKLGLKVALLTGAVKGKARKQLLQQLEDGEIALLTGTHALIESTVVFKQLGIVIIDEQHRFGVHQRAKIGAKSDQPPHILVMTATPIPRTLAKTWYGDLDVSVLDELPPGRKPIQTFWRTDTSRLGLFSFLRTEIAAGRQVYVVYPLIEESEKSDLKDLMDGYESFSRAFPKPDYQLSILHGRMRQEDKDYEMQRFIRNETQILVATTVIEVGVNVPNASVMVIENAERFGLSQLHQLRGRVGRGAEKSYCILMAGEQTTADARKRLEIMCRTQNGFEIAEEDLKIRGPGDMDGTQQSGQVDLKLADLVTDGPLLDQAREYARQILEEDPGLASNANLPLRDYLQQLTAGKIWTDIG